MEKEELRKKIARIHTAILTHTPVGRDENDFPVAATQTYLYDFISQELDKARREGEIEVLTEIFQTCYQEDSKTLELVEEKLSKLKDNK